MSITFQVAVSSWSAGPPNANGAVSFYDGGTLLSTVPVNASGQAGYTTSSLSAGTHTITAAYAGGTNYASGSESVTITLTHQLVECPAGISNSVRGLGVRIHTF
jgi:hypothetical protein